MNKVSFTAGFKTDEGLAHLFDMIKKYRNELASNYNGDYYISRIEIYNDNYNCEATATVDEFKGVKK